MEQGREAVVALGTFDGMHIGHRALIERAVTLAKTLGCEAAVYTFLNHPMTVLGGEVRMLGTPEERAGVMRALGVTDVCMAPFTRTFAGASPEAFVGQLCSRWRVRALVVGFNYTFGAFGAGTPETLCTLGRLHGFSVEVLPPVLLEDAPVSSTRIRNEIELGHMESAARMLNHAYALSGKAFAAPCMNRALGLSAAAIVPENDRVLPKFGVYAADATVGGRTCRALARVGTSRADDGEHPLVEVSLPGFDGDRSGETLCVAFLSYLHGEQAASSAEALAEQIARDAKDAARFRPKCER